MDNLHLIYLLPIVAHRNEIRVSSPCPLNDHTWPVLKMDDERIARDPKQDNSGSTKYNIAQRPNVSLANGIDILVLMWAYTILLIIERKIHYL